MQGPFKSFSLLLIVLALCSALAFGQAETGQITGTVTDPQGAVVSGAKVTMRNTATSAERTSTTTGNGLYTFTNLPPGPYEVRVESANFQATTKRIDVTVGSRNTVDFPLALTGSQTTVEVVGEGGVQVETENQQLSQVVTGQQITELPTITRNAYTLVGTAGNVAPSDAARGAGYSINGQRDASTNILLDGGENVDLFSATPGQATPLDSIGEFRVITNNFSAEYGRASGGIVNVSTKQGTNTFHGTLFEFYRGAALTSNTYDNNAQMSLALQAHAADPIVNPTCASVDDPTCPGRKGGFTRNQFGYSVGGPIVKDKLFFFSSTEWIRVRSTANITAAVPSASFIAASDPATQNFFTTYGALKPEARPAGNPEPGVSTGALYDIISYPVGANAGGGDPENEYQSVARVDFNMTDKTQIYGRYALQSQDFFAGTTSNSPYVGFDTGTNVFNNNLMLNLTHIWGPNVVTQSKVVFNRLNNFQPLNGPPSPTLYMKGGSTQRTPGGTRIALPGYLPFNPGSAIPFGGPQNLYQIYQDLSWTVGKHQFRFGGQYIHTRDNRTFGAFETAVEVLGTDLASAEQNFLNGTQLQFQTAVDPQGHFPCPSDATGAAIVTPECQVTLPVTQPRFNRSNRYHDMALYGEDSWKIHPRLTLNLGLRWEYYGVQHNNDPSFDSNFYLGPGANYFEQVRNGTVMTSNDPNNPVGGLWEPDYNNFAPRIGFAWDLFGDGRTSLRGGYGISYERNFGNVTFNVIQNPPNYAVISVFQGADCPGTCPISTDNFGPLGGGAPGAVVDLPKTSLRAPAQDLQTAYAHFWSLALEREIARNTVFALEYSGSRGVNLYSIENPNRPGAGVLYLGDDPTLNPFGRLNRQYSGFNRRGQTGSSDYHGLNVRVQTNNLMNSGLSFVTNYTWSHAIDNLSSTFSEFGNNFNLGYLDPFNPDLDRGNADFDVRHRWVLSGTWDTPWYRNSDNWFARNVVGGWTLAPIVTVQSGNPFSLWDCTFVAFEVCPRLIPNTQELNTSAHDAGIDLGGNNFDYITIDPTNYAFYTNSVLGISEFGECGVGEGATTGCPFPAQMYRRNSFRSPGQWNVDLGVYKNFKVTERMSLQLRGEAFNIANHSNLFVQGSGADASTTIFPFYFDQDGNFFPAGNVQCTVGTCPAAVTAKKGGFGDAALDERRNLQLGIKLIF